MTYSKKHFKDIARILRESKDEIPQIAFEDLVCDFVDLFRAYNPAFDETIFAEACDIDAGVILTS